MKIQTVCGFGCGSSLMLKMNMEKIIKDYNFDAELFCGDIATCLSNECDAIFISKDLAERIVGRTDIPIIIIDNFTNKNEVEEKTLAFFNK